MSRAWLLAAMCLAGSASAQERDAGPEVDAARRLGRNTVESLDFARDERDASVPDAGSSTASQAGNAGAADGGPAPELDLSDARLWATEFGIGTNVAQYESNGRVTWQGRLVALRVVVRGFTVDFRTQFTSVFPLGPDPLRGSAELRLGYSARRWAVEAGVYVLDGFSTQPRFLSILPSARAQVSFGGLSLVAGLWDFHLPALPFRLSVESTHFGIGFVYPFGVEAHLRLRLAEFIGITAQGVVVQVGRDEVIAYGTVMATLGVMSGKAPGARALIPALLDPRR